MKTFVHTHQGPATAPANCDPGAVLPFGVEWGDWFGDDVPIVSATWDIGSLTKGQDGIRATYTINGVTYRNVALIQLSGFQDGVQHTVTCRATSSMNDVDEKSFILIGQSQ